MYQKRNEKRKKKNQEEVEEEKEEELEEEEQAQEEEIRRGLSNKRFVCYCIIENTSLTFYWLFIYCFQMDGGWGRWQLRMGTWRGTCIWKKDEY